MLSASRQTGMGAAPLALRDMVTYWESISCISELKEFIHIIQGMDRLWLDKMREKQK